MALWQDSGAQGYLFAEIYVARIRLIRELRDDLLVNEEAMPIVLSLWDQLYAVRRRMRELGQAVGRIAPEELRQNILTQLTARIEPDR